MLNNRQAAAELYRLDRGHITTWILSSFIFLVLGGLFGPLQALDKMNVDLYPYLQGAFRSYYLGLHIHGVALALLFVFAFNVGFLSLLTVHGLKRPLVSQRMAWLSFWMFAVGVVIALVPILRNEATVLWTFYAPLRAHPGFYLGLSLVVISTWIAALNGYLTWRAWKREHPSERTPLMAFASLATWAMWLLSSVGLAVGVVVFLLPWSLNLFETINPLLTRALYWFSGHPIVYFWLLPAYIAWYTILPAQVGGKLFSESLARLVFLLFIPFAVPTGLHHMYTDPGVAHSSKVIHGLLTFVVVFPSLLTAFTVLASIEEGARRRGARGRFLWLFSFPWFRDASVAGQLLAMLMFAGGGITGIINASYNMNMLIHNSLWVAGHIHFQVGTSVALTFMAVSYFLIPLLTGHALWSPRMAVWQVWTWFIGMAVMGRGLNWLGLAGAPRRVYLSQAPYAVFDTWQVAGLLAGLGGIIVTVSGILFILNVVMTLLNRKSQSDITELPESEPLFPVKNMPLLLDRISPWVVLGIILTAIAWLPPLYQIAVQSPWVEGWRLW